MRSIESIVRDGRETTVTCTCCRGTGMMAIGLAYPHTLDALTSDWRTLAQITDRLKMKPRQNALANRLVKLLAYGLVERRPCPDNYKLLQYRRRSW